MNQTVSWLILLFVGILIVIIGFTGSIGKIVAVAFTPGLLESKTGGESIGTF